MKKFQNKIFVSLLVVSFVIMAIGFNDLQKVQAATSPTLGLASSYAVLASTFTNTSAGTTINGDIGFTTGPAVTPGGTRANYGTAAPYASAGSDQGSALSALNSQACTFTFASGAINLSTDTTHGAIGVYTPGVYCVSGAMNVGGPLTLNGSGTYIFRSTGALTTMANAAVTLSGASVCDVFWTPAAATTLAANTVFKGTVISNAGITIGANTNWVGRALSFGGTTTSDTDTISAPTCSNTSSTTSDSSTVYVIPASLRIVKVVVNSNGGTAVPSNFILHVKNANVDVAGSPAVGVSAPGTNYSLAPGIYNVSENASSTYVSHFSGDCDLNGNIILTEGVNKICTIMNTDMAAVIATATPLIITTTTPTTTPTTTFIPAIVAVPVIATATPLVVPVPGLPNTGLTPQGINTPWNIIISISALVLVISSLALVLKNEK
jgi:hypothetical protein